MINLNKISIELSSNLDYEGMIIDITYKDSPSTFVQIGSVNYEKGINNIEIELFPIPQAIQLPIADLLESIEKAKALAIKCAKEDGF